VSDLPEPRRFDGLLRDEILGFRVPVASTRRSRLLGLAFLDRKCAGEGLLIPRCRRVHTFGMRFPLDLIFLDAQGKVAEIRRQVPPRRLVRCPRATSVLELPSP
jgi:uncharacterized membrane protein (UPF0127 family)